AVAAVGHGFDQQANRIVVIGNLQLGRVQPCQRVAEVAEVIVLHADQLEVGELATGDKAVELALPLLVAVIVGEALIKAAKIGIGVGAESGAGRGGDDRAAGVRIGQLGDGVGRTLVVV